MKERNEEQASERRETYQKRTRILATKIELTICIEINIIRPSVENKEREMELTGGQQIIKQLHKKNSGSVGKRACVSLRYLSATTN